MFFNLANAQEHKQYYDNGNLKVTGIYDENGQKTGEWKSYHENGKLYSVGKFENGKATGKWKFFDENGNLTKTETY